MTLEERLRSELRRAAPESVPSPPSIGEMASTVASRRRRNRIVMGVGAAVLALGVAGGILAAVQPESASDVVASAPDDANASTDDTTADATTTTEPEGQNGDASTVTEPEPSEGDSRALIEAPSIDTTETAELPNADAEIAVSTRESAVDFAGGSGVLLARVGEGYAGLASRFGGDAGVMAIGLRSTDGLDWTEVELTGVPAGATATAMTERDGTFVALFSLFDVDAQRNNTFVGTSTDLAEWSLAPALPGQDSVATGLAVGLGGVIVVGVAPAPAVWVGPIGGPYEAAGSIADAQTLAGIVAIDSGFVAVGTSPELGPTLFDSVDGAEWSATPMSSIGDEDTVISLSVMNGTIMLAGDDGDTGWTATSSDGGQSWLRNELDSGMVSSVASSGSTISFLGTSSLGSATVTLSDGRTWSSTELDVVAPDRLELLVAGIDEAVLLANIDGTLTWIVAER